jgi:hypothetical protein
MNVSPWTAFGTMETHCKTPTRRAAVISPRETDAGAASFAEY